MPERAPKSEIWQAAAPLTIGPLTLLPIEHVVRHQHIGRGQAWYVVSKTPYALVLCDAAGVRAIGPGDSAVSIDEVRLRVPDLDAALAAV